MVELGKEDGEILLRMNTVSWAAPLVLPYTVIYTNSLLSDTVD